MELTGSIQPQFRWTQRGVAAPARVDVCSISQSREATIEHFTGYGLMAFFNDPLLCPDLDARAVRDVGALIDASSKRGINRGSGIGISSRYASFGHIGSEEQFHYAAIGSVANLASRLCDEAKSGQILITQPVYAAIENISKTERVGELTLKGFPKAVPVLQVVAIEHLDSEPSAHRGGD